MPMKKQKQKPSLATMRYAFRMIIWPRRRLVLIGLSLILINRLAGLVLPGSSKYLLDNAIGAGNYALFQVILLAITASVTLQAVTSFALTRLLSVEAQHLISELRAKVQEHVIHLPMNYFNNNKTGAIVSRIMTDVEGVRNLVGTGLVQLVGGALASFLALGLLITINVWMTIFLLIPLLTFGVISLKTFGYIRPIFRERRRIQAEVTGRLTETLNGIQVIKGFNAEDHEIQVFKVGVESLFNNIKRTLTATSLVTSTGTFLLGIAAVLIMGYGGLQIMAGVMTPGDLLAFILYLGFLVAPILQISNIGSQMTEALAGLDRTAELLGVGRESDDESRDTILGEIKGDLEFDSVSFAYEDGPEVVKEISFCAPAGSVTALVGSSGSGKTTIAGLAGSFLTPQGGKITVDGKDLCKATLGSYRSQLGVVLQDDFLFDGTIEENILFGRPAAGEEALKGAVIAAHVQEFAAQYEDKLQTVIGERGVKLSGGQRQRVAIARALISDPKVLILDEATSNLDTESERYIQKSLETLLQGRTTLVIAHRLSTIRRADQILVIEGGSIVERGTHDQLMESGGRYHQLYTYQARI
jgi:subfamily B ATP-binding cassette protein MsbA